MSTEVRYSRLFLRPAISGEEYMPTEHVVIWRRLGGMWEAVEDYPVEMWACEHWHRTRGEAAACKGWRG